jgi:D-methionine transport system ATP-binding protein
VALIEFEQVSLQAPVGIQLILQDLSFAIEAGSCVALVGASGSGKTSLLRLCNRLVDPSTGRIWFEGKDLRTLPAVPLRHQIALVLQDSKLLEMTVEAALCYPSQLRGLSPAAAKQQMQPWLERLQIPRDWLRKTERELSMGQRQRVAIARSLITEPRLLLLDEPTSAQDIGYATFLLKLLRTLINEHGLTVMMANHQLDLTADFATHLLQLDQGRLVQALPAAKVDWPNLRQAIIEASDRATQEWDDAL